MKVYHQKITTIRKEQHKKLKKSCPFGTAPSYLKYPIIMKQMKFLKSLLIYFILTGVIACNKYANNVPHLGENKVSIENIMFDWDSCEVDIFYTGGQGNFFMKDSIISFASHSQAKIYNYDCSNFELITSHFGFGNGPDELLRFFYATPIMNDTSFFIINNNMDVTLYNNQFKLDKKGPLDFQWGKSQIGAYDSPSVYNFMLRTDFGVISNFACTTFGNVACTEIGNMACT